MKTYPAISVLAFLLASFTILSAQNAPIKFGEIDPADFEITDCDFEPGAAAIVLDEYGEGKFRFDIDGGSALYYELEYIVRIKILTKNGLDRASVDLKYFVGETGNFTTIQQVKAAAYNLENDQIEKQEIQKNDLYRVALSKNWKVLNFAIPGVRVGSIIEYAYVLRTKNIVNMTSWYFQKDIPVRCSHFSLEDPETVLMECVYRGNQKPDSLYVEEGKGYKGASHWTLRDLPSIRSEPYAAAQRDFSPHIEFQLLKIRRFSGYVKDIASDYSKLNENLLKNYYFGEVVKPRLFEKKLVQNIVDGMTEEKEKAAAILKYFQENVAWDKVYSRFSNYKTSEIFEEGKADVASINLALTACMRAAGIDADPVILGTRDHGRPNPVYPNMGKFNFVIVALNLNGKTVLADATGPDLPLGYISKDCLHFAGWKVSEKDPGWIPLQQDATADYTAYFELKPDGKNWSGKVNFKNTNYAAIEALKNIREDKDEYLHTLEKSLITWNPQNSTYLEIDKTNPKVSVEMEISRQIDLADLIYLEAFHPELFSKNPFDANERISPVNFPCLINLNYVIRVQLPEGYEASELPGNKTLAFDSDQSMVYKYRCSISDGWLMIVSNLRMNRSFYLQEEYPDLREFFDHIISKNHEMVVLAQK